MSAWAGKWSAQRVGALVRAALWLLALLLIVVGVPLVLIHLGGLPWPKRWPTSSRLHHLLGGNIPASDENNMFLGAGWVVWLYALAGIATQAILELRHDRRRRSGVLGPSQAAARSAIEAARSASLGPLTAARYGALLGAVPRPAADLEKRREQLALQRDEATYRPPARRIERVGPTRLPSWVDIDPSALWWVDAGLRQVASECARAGVAMPSVSMVTVNGDGLDLWIDGDRPEPPPLWDELDDTLGWWSCSRSAKTARRFAEHHRRPFPTPMLVPVWTNDVGALVLVNIARFGSFGVDRPDADDLLRAIVQGCGLAPWLDELTIVTQGDGLEACDADLAVVAGGAIEVGGGGERMLLVVTESPASSIVVDRPSMVVIGTGGGSATLTADSRIVGCGWDRAIGVPAAA